MSRSSFTSHDQSIYIKSSDFPNEYSASLDCSCQINSARPHSLKMEVLWFSLQDNDFLNLFNNNISGWINPTTEWPLSSTKNTIRFLTDDALAYKGFWLKLSTRKQCSSDWQLVGDSCIKVFTDSLDWRSANKQCQKMNGNLLKIDNVITDLKLTQYMKMNYPSVGSYWIGLRKYLDEFSKEKWMWSNNSTQTTTAYDDVSWWPWKDVSDTSSEENNCVTKHKDEDGYFTTSCDPANKNSFICQSQAVPPPGLHETALVSLKCGPTEKIQQDDITTIGINSINNIIIPHKLLQAATNQKTPTTTTSNLQQKHEEEQDEMLFNLQTAKITQLYTEFKKISTKLSSSSSSPLRQRTTLTIPFVDNTQQQQPQTHTDFKLNTTVLAGIISGIGLVIVVINLAVLYLCRRNLKNFLKSPSSASSSSSSSSASSSSTTSSGSSSSSLNNKTLNKNVNLRDDLIQEYFEAFNTMHKPTTANITPIALMNTIHRLQQQQQLLSQNNSSDESLLTSTFLRSQQDQEMLIKRQLLQLQQTNHNQYDKMNHQSSKADQDQQQQHYAHTYECLDNLEMPVQNKQLQRGGNGIHLGISGRTSQRNYRNNNTTDLNSFNTDTTTNTTDLANFNVSTSSNASSSGVSSQHQFINNNNSKLHLLNSTGNTHLNTLNGSKQLLQQQQQNSQFLKFNNTGDLINVSNIANGNNGGTWSPDSAYYSAIPTLTNYNNYNLKLLHQQQLQLQSADHQFNNSNNNQQFVNSSFNSNVNSHLV